ncbi:MAG: SDR family oxidoreductase [Myxococcales bacterium]|nr:SDR family oxidoreductase [Myxococcales bacterium]
MGVLDGRVAIVTGGARGVGRGISLAFAKEGAKVAIAEINEETGPATEAEIRGLGLEATFIPCDVSKRDHVERTVATTVAAYGGVDILVNCATGARPATAFRSFLEHTDEQVGIQLGVEVWGSFFFMQTCHPYLAKSPHARVLNICSMAGTERAAGFMIYSAAKEALRAMSGVAAREWGADGINVNVLCPTAATEATMRWREENPEVAAAGLKSVALGRFGDAEWDIGRAAVFLVGDDAGFITGQTLMVDGGAVIHA